MKTTTPSRVVFVGRCDNLRCEDLDDFDETSKSITHATFRRRMGGNYLPFEESLGYGKWLRMAKDYHIRYVAGTWKGSKAVCCFWSAYHHIFVTE